MKWAIVCIYLFSILFIHFRGRVRLPFLRQFFDHSSIMSPINLFMYAFSRVPAVPYPAVKEFKELALIDAHWETIRDEAVALREMAKIKAADNNDDAGFNSFFKAGWKRFYLKWYNASHPSAEKFCPKTVEILQRIPSVKAAMFAELAPGGTLNPHRDPFAGSLRYHLGLVTPNDDRCFIEVDGQRYSWRDGQSVVFDETFIHWAQNGTETNRIILFCDIERPMKYRWAAAFNRWFSRNVMAAAGSPNDAGDKTGALNRAFTRLYKIRLRGKELKKRNRTRYYLEKWAIFAGLALIFIYI